MNRIIEFRAWDSLHKKWFDGNVLYLMSQAYIPAEDVYVFLQFTGLEDKNGREIYEGDIIETADCMNEYKLSRLQIVFYNGYFLATDEISQEEYLWDISEASRVVGNIYENPELKRHEQ